MCDSCIFVQYHAFLSGGRREGIGGGGVRRHTLGMEKRANVPCLDWNPMFHGADVASPAYVAA